MKNYELSFLVSTEISTEEAQGFSAQIAGIIQKEAGQNVKISNPVPKTLGYKIKGQSSALWMNIEFSLEPDKLKEVEKELKKDPRIIRYLISIKKPQRITEARVRRSVESKTTEPIKEAIQEEKKQEKKVELKDIDEKLEEILGE